MRRICVICTISVPLIACAENETKPDQALRDCVNCPSLVIIPDGSFQMGGGSPWSSASDENTGPTIAISSFALGKYEVTFAEWNVCVSAGACDRQPDDQGWGRGARPVIDVSWEDAQQYVSWLSEHTGQQYRLPSDSEWEYAARAGRTTRYWFGDKWTDLKNVVGRHAYHSLKVGSHSANDWGLYEMESNVWEWVEDRYYEDYDLLPTDGAPHIEGTEHRRLRRGGSPIFKSNLIPHSDRSGVPPTQRNANAGFRVARDL